MSVIHLYDPDQETKAACAAPRQMGINLFEIILAQREGREPVERLLNPPSLPASGLTIGLINCTACKEIWKAAQH